MSELALPGDINTPIGQQGAFRSTEANKLVNTLEGEFGLRCQGAPRGYWNGKEGGRVMEEFSLLKTFLGLQLIKTLAIKDERKPSTLMSVSDK